MLGKYCVELLSFVDCTGILPSNVWSYSGSTGTLATCVISIRVLYIRFYIHVRAHAHTNVAFCVAYVQRVTVQGNFLPNFVFTPNVSFSLPPEDSDWSKVGPVETSWPSLPDSTLSPHDTLESVLGRLGLLDYYHLLQVIRHST